MESHFFVDVHCHPNRSTINIPAKQKFSPNKLKNNHHAIF